MTAQQQLPGQDEHTIKMNAWFTASFEALVAPHLKYGNKNFKAIGKAFKRHHAELEAIIKVLSSGKKDADGAYILRTLDDVLAKFRDEMRAEMVAVLKQHDTGGAGNSNSSVAKVVGVIDQILAPSSSRPASSASSTRPKGNEVLRAMRC